jgi:hypothetical protein
MDGSVRRENMIELTAMNFTRERRLNPKEHKLVEAAARIGMLEAVRGCLFVLPLSPSDRKKMEEHWGFSGVTRISPQTVASMSADRG